MIVPTYGVWMCKTTVPQPRIDTPATKGEQEQKVFPKVTYGVWMCNRIVPQPRIDTPATKGEQLSKKYFLG